MKSYKKILILLATFNGIRMLVGATSAIFLITIKGFSVNEISLLKGLQFLLWLILDVPSSYLADKKSKKNILIFSMIFSMVWLIITSLSNIKSLIYMAEVCNSISLTLLSGTGTAFLIKFYKKEEQEDDVTKIIANQEKYNNIAMIVAILFSSLFLTSQLNSLWLYSGLSAGILIIASLFFLPQDFITNTIDSNSFKKDLIIVKKMLFTKKILFIALSFSLFIGYFNNVINYNQVVTYNAFPKLNQPFFHSIIFAIIMAVQTLSAHTKNNKTKFFYIYLILICYGLMLFTPPIVNLILFITVYYCTTKIFILLSSELHNSISDNLRATLDSVVNSFGLFVAFFLSLFIYNQYSGLKILFFMFFIIFLFILLLQSIDYFYNTSKLSKNKILIQNQSDNN